MYGVPSDLPLDRLVGKELIAIRLGQFQIELQFEGGGTISIEGGWELRDPAGTLLDAQEEHAHREGYRIHRVLGLSVEAFEIDAPGSFTLILGAGHRLLVFDDDPHYETCTVQVEGLGLYVI
jgi:hypothetical protein